MEVMNLDQLILRHLEEQEISDQKVLLDLLEAEGLDLTLATLSRHLKKLNVRKEVGVYRRMEPPPIVPVPFTTTKVRPNLLIVKTGSGLAQALALALDKSDLRNLAGTVAGDDTLFCAPFESDQLDALEIEVRKRLSEGLGLDYA
jgi:transcriptional regulator of arginine metabolism